MRTIGSLADLASDYRNRCGRAGADRNTVVDVATSINEYLDRSDWRVSADANQSCSLGGLILNLSGKVVANYWLLHNGVPGKVEAGQPKSSRQSGCGVPSGLNDNGPLVREGHGGIGIPVKCGLLTTKIGSIPPLL